MLQSPFAPTLLSLFFPSGELSVFLLSFLLYPVLQEISQLTSGLLFTRFSIRYAAAPTGSLRWQAPRTPPVNRTVVVADTLGPRCAQGLNSGTLVPFGDFPGEEDCLFVNVYSPATAGRRPLPVLVYIHGGGYGVGDGRPDMTPWLGSTGNNVVIVAIQYRLGPFGFLSSPEIKSRGVLNAGLLDMKFALDWVQHHILQFGGDPIQVTLVGDSAGGGAGLLLSTAENGSWGTSRFKQVGFLFVGSRTDRPTTQSCTSRANVTCAAPGHRGVSLRADAAGL
jgi:acetyl esterase/lipase